MIPLRNGSDYTPVDAKGIREEFQNYFVSEGEVPWQYDRLLFLTFSLLQRNEYTFDNSNILCILFCFRKKMKSREAQFQVN